MENLQKNHHALVVTTLLFIFFHFPSLNKFLELSKEAFKHTMQFFFFENPEEKKMSSLKNHSLLSFIKNFP